MDLRPRAAATGVVVPVSEDQEVALQPVSEPRNHLSCILSQQGALKEYPAMVSVIARCSHSFTKSSGALNGASNKHLQSYGNYLYGRLSLEVEYVTTNE